MIQLKWNTVSPEEYNLLRRAVGWKEVSDKQARTALNQSMVISAIENGRILGMARSLTDSIQSILMDVMVLPECQGRGIGTMLMKALLCYEKETISSGGEKYVSILALLGKESFYSNLGFLERPNVLQGAGMTIKLLPERHYKFENE